MSLPGRLDALPMALCCRDVQVSCSNDNVPQKTCNSPSRASAGETPPPGLVLEKGIGSGSCIWVLQLWNLLGRASSKPGSLVRTCYHSPSAGCCLANYQSSFTSLNLCKSCTAGCCWPERPRGAPAGAGKRDPAKADHPSQWLKCVPSVCMPTACSTAVHMRPLTMPFRAGITPNLA